MRPRSVRRGPLTVFIHIPKTAGTTLVGVLRGNFTPAGVRTIGNVFHGAGGVDAGPVHKLKKSGRVLIRDIHLLGGHLPFGVHQYLPVDTRYITFLRDPVERTLSHYYRLLDVRKRDPIPEGMSFAQVLGGGEYLYDNLQTRMLCSDPEPFGKVTDKMLEQAKENLTNGFVCFGLADRFDESLALLKRRLQLRSILYVSKRMTTTRPRTEESKEDLIPLAERFNEYDIELYKWASKRFEETVAEQDADFAVDVAALRTAVSGGPVTQTPPAASKITREQLWKELVSARADLLGWEYEAAKAHDPSQSLVAEQEDDLRALLKQSNESLLQLRDRMEELETRLRVTHAPADDGPEPTTEQPGRQRRRWLETRLRATSAPDDDAPDDDETEPTAEEPGRQRRRERAKSAGRLAQLHAQIAQLEEAVGEQPESARDVHVVRELERLRALVAEVEEQARGGQKRAARADDAAGSKAERRQTPHQRSTRIESLTKTRDNSEAVVARTEGQLAAIRSELHDLEAAAANGGSAADVDDTIQKEKIERLSQLAAEKEKRLELAKSRLAQVERRLTEMTPEAAAKTPSDSSSTATVPPDFDTGEESR